MAITLSSFMNALGQKESGGNYNAVNQHSGAHGKYQIMPANWAPWAREAGLPSNAPKTPQNQETVARNKIQQYFNKYGNWADVASSWYSGRPLSQVDPNRSQGQYPTIRAYVDSVLQAAGGATNEMPPPGVEGGPTGSSQAGTYTVRRGDTLGAIANRFGTTVSALANANGISNPDVINVGQILRIPGQGDVQGRAPTSNQATSGSGSNVPPPGHPAGVPDTSSGSTGGGGGDDIFGDPGGGGGGDDSGEIVRQYTDADGNVHVVVIPKGTGVTRDIIIGNTGQGQDDNPIVRTQDGVLYIFPRDNPTQFQAIPFAAGGDTTNVTVRTIDGVVYGIDTQTGDILWNVGSAGGGGQDPNAGPGDNIRTETEYRSEPRPGNYLITYEWNPNIRDWVETGAKYLGIGYDGHANQPSAGIPNEDLSPGTNTVFVPSGAGIPYDRFNPNYTVYVPDGEGGMVELGPGMATPGEDWIRIDVPGAPFADPPVPGGSGGSGTGAGGGGGTTDTTEEWGLNDRKWRITWQQNPDTGQWEVVNAVQIGVSYDVSGPIPEDAPTGIPQLDAFLGLSGGGGGTGQPGGGGGGGTGQPGGGDGGDIGETVTETGYGDLGWQYRTTWLQNPQTGQWELIDVKVIGRAYNWTGEPGQPGEASGIPGVDAFLAQQGSGGGGTGQPGGGTGQPGGGGTGQPGGGTGDGTGQPGTGTPGGGTGTPDDGTDPFGGGRQYPFERPPYQTTDIRGPGQYYNPQSGREYRILPGGKLEYRRRDSNSWYTQPLVYQTPMEFLESVGAVAMDGSGGGTPPGGGNEPPPPAPADPDGPDIPEGEDPAVDIPPWVGDVSRMDDYYWDGNGNLIYGPTGQIVPPDQIPPNFPRPDGSTGAPSGQPGSDLPDWTRPFTRVDDYQWDDDGNLIHIPTGQTVPPSEIPPGWIPPGSAPPAPADPRTTPNPGAAGPPTKDPDAKTVGPNDGTQPFDGGQRSVPVEDLPPWVRPHTRIDDTPQTAAQSTNTPNQPDIRSQQSIRGTPGGNRTEMLRRRYSGFAQGGEADPTQPFVVGEPVNGQPNPELVIPEEDGDLRIVPFRDLQGFQTGGTIPYGDDQQQNEIPSSSYNVPQGWDAWQTSTQPFQDIREGIAQTAWGQQNPYEGQYLRGLHRSSGHYQPSDEFRSYVGDYQQANPVTGTNMNPPGTNQQAPWQLPQDWSQPFAYMYEPGQLNEWKQRAIQTDVPFSVSLEDPRNTEAFLRLYQQWAQDPAGFDPRILERYPAIQMVDPYWQSQPPGQSDPNPNPPSNGGNGGNGGGGGRDVPDNISDLQDNIRRMKEADLPPGLNPFAVDWENMDPVIRRMFYEDREDEFGVPVESQRHMVQKQRLPGRSRNAINLSY